MNLNAENPSFYKYKSIKDFFYFVDVVLNNQLFASFYPSLNDPMEGHYYYGPDKLASNVRQLIKCEKNSLRICCLSAKQDDPLMWAHYADGNRGVMLKVKVPNNQTIQITYDDKLHRSKEEDILDTKKIAKTVLSYKKKAWSYEKEYRVFAVPEKDGYIPITLEKVVLGSRMEEHQKELIKLLVRKLSREVVVEDSKIGVIRKR